MQEGAAGTVRVLCPTPGGGEAALPLPIAGIAALRQLVVEQFGDALPGQVRQLAAGG